MTYACRVVVARITITTGWAAASLGWQNSGPQTSGTVITQAAAYVTFASDTGRGG